MIDFTQNSISENGNPLLEANPGGAPCNVLSMLHRLGRKTAFIGKVGRDSFGNQLKSALQENGIDVKYLKMDDEVPTTLAFVHKLANGNRDFSFYRNPGADMMLRQDEVEEEVFANMKLFHFGTLSMTHENVKAATIKALELAKKKNVRISFDPNLRFQLWKTLDDMRNAVICGLSYCDILKISDNEIQWLTGETDFDIAVKWIQEKFPNISFILLTLGEKGSLAYTKDCKVYAKGFAQENIVDTTGAGDTFCGCILSFLCDADLSAITENEMEKMLRFANGAASIITTRKGALRVMPTIAEVEDIMKQ